LVHLLKPPSGTIHAALARAQGPGWLPLHDPQLELLLLHHSWSFLTASLSTWVGQRLSKLK
jgi:hypothetical protein